MTLLPGVSGDLDPLPLPYTGGCYLFRCLAGPTTVRIGVKKSYSSKSPILQPRVPGMVSAAGQGECFPHPAFEADRCGAPRASRRPAALTRAAGVRAFRLRGRLVWLTLPLAPALSSAGSGRLVPAFLSLGGPVYWSGPGPARGRKMASRGGIHGGKNFCI